MHFLARVKMLFSELSETAVLKSETDAFKTRQIVTDKVGSVIMAFESHTCMEKCTELNKCIYRNYPVQNELKRVSSKKKKTIVNLITTVSQNFYSHAVLSVTLRKRNNSVGFFMLPEMHTGHDAP